MPAYNRIAYGSSVISWHTEHQILYVYLCSSIRVAHFHLAKMAQSYLAKIDNSGSKLFSKNGSLLLDIHNQS